MGTIGGVVSRPSIARVASNAQTHLEAAAAAVKVALEAQQAQPSIQDVAVGTVPPASSLGQNQAVPGTPRSG